MKEMKLNPRKRKWPIGLAMLMMIAMLQGLWMGGEKVEQDMEESIVVPTGRFGPRTEQPPREGGQDEFVDRFIEERQQVGLSSVVTEDLLNKTELLMKFHRIVYDTRSALKNDPNLDSLPPICETPLGFRKPPGKSFFLASVPGSGNTWLRIILEQGTRIYTGSVYKDGYLMKKGFKGEARLPNKGQTLFVKTHFPANPTHEFPLSWAAGALHVVRAPFDAHLADCHRFYGNHRRRMKIKEDIMVKCKDYAIRKSRGWKKMLRFWQGEGLFSQNLTTENVRFKSFTNKTMFTYLESGTFPVITMFYEDFVTDFKETLVELFAAINLFFGPEIAPSPIESIHCVVQHLSVLEKAHRKETTTGELVNPYLNETTHTILDFAQTLCDKMYFPFWNQHKWGQCSGLLQRQRP